MYYSHKRHPRPICNTCAFYIHIWCIVYYIKVERHDFKVFHLNSSSFADKKNWCNTLNALYSYIYIDSPIIFERNIKNKTNHPISSNSHTSATANEAIHSLKRKRGYKTNGNIIWFWQSMKRCIRRPFRKIIPQVQFIFKLVACFPIPISICVIISECLWFYIYK